MRLLTEADAIPAVVGGTILGGGGGGHADRGLEMAHAALASGDIWLAGVDDLEPEAVVAACRAAVPAPAPPGARGRHPE